MIKLLHKRYSTVSEVCLIICINLMFFFPIVCECRYNKASRSFKNSTDTKTDCQKTFRTSSTIYRYIQNYFFFSFFSFQFKQMLLTQHFNSTEAHPSTPKLDSIKNLSMSISNTLTPAKSSPVINNGSPTILGKRSYEQHNGMDGTCLYVLYFLFVFA